jgi:hypothetical protein
MSKRRPNEADFCALSDVRDHLYECPIWSAHEKQPRNGSGQPLILKKKQSRAAQVHLRRKTAEKTDPYPVFI